MADEVDVSIESGFLAPSGVTYGSLTVRLLGLPPDDRQEPLADAAAAKFFQRVEEKFSPPIRERLQAGQPNLNVTVSCFAAQKGSLEFVIIILASGYTVKVTAEGIHKFIVDYPKFKQGLAEIAADIKKAGTWLKETAARSFDWITGRSPQKKQNDETPVATVSPDDDKHKKADREAFAKKLKNLKDKAPKKKPFK